MVDLLSKDPVEERDMASRRIVAADEISSLVGSEPYVLRHPLNGLRLRLPGGFESTELAVWRFYFSADPPTAVDLAEGAKPQEVAAKRIYCEARDWRYILMETRDDIPGLTQQLREADAPTPAPAAGPAPKVVVGPSRRKK